MIPFLLHSPIAAAAAAMCVERPDRAGYERFDFDDGTVRILGTTPTAVREALLLTHVEGGHDSDGLVIWYPKGADDDS